MITRRVPLKRSRLKRKPRKAKPGDDQKYLRWIRTLPCLVCFKALHLQLSPTEPAHVGKTRKGMSVKCIDREAIPLCAECHRTGPYAHHKLTARGGAAFFDHHGINREKIIAELNAKYNARYEAEGA